MFDPADPDAPFSGQEEMLPRLASFPEEEIVSFSFWVGDMINWEEWYLVFTDVKVTVLIGTLHGRQ